MPGAGTVRAVLLASVLGIDVDFLEVPTSTLQIFVVVLVLSIIAGLGLVVLTTLATPLVDKRWPADEPLNPTEMLWGESGGYIKRHFPGLDVEIGKDINSQFTEVKVPAGEAVVEQGDPATHFYVLKDGEVEVSQELPDGGVRPIRRHSPGDTFGEVGILRRTPRTATIRATVDSTVMQLPAEEFVAGVAFSAAEGNVLLARVNEYMAADAARAEQTVAAAPTATVATVAAEATEAPATADTTTMAHDDDDADAFTATHVVPASGLLAWVHPDPDEEPAAQLAAGVELRVVAESGAWARVEAANGWTGWVDGRALQPR
jgi:CRP-like cAMP-binding protein